MHWQFFYAYALGLFSILSPCTFILVPVMAAQKKRRSMILFLVGVLLVYLLLGILAIGTGKLLTNFMGSSLYILAAIVTTIAGLDMIGWIQIPKPRISVSTKNNFVSGLLYGAVSLSCVGPVLAAILSIVIIAPPSLGVIMIVLFSLGFITPFLILGLIFTSQRIHSKIARYTRTLQIIGAVMLLGVALYLLYFGLRGFM